MGERFSRSWLMIKHSLEILQQDRELLVFPLLSSIAAILIVVSFIPLFVLDAGMIEEQYQLNYLALGLLYLTEYFVVFFFNSALVGAVMIRMDGGNPTVSDGLRIAWSKIGQILGYTIIAATVGLLLRAVGERFGIIGRIIAGLLGMGWTAASFLAVPVLVSRNLGPVDAVRESASLLKRTWGENIMTNAGIGLVFMLFYVLAFIVIGLLVSVVMATGNLSLIVIIITLSILGIIILGLIQAALQGIFSAVLYRFATDGQQTGGFSTDVLSRAFTPKLKYPGSPG
jgi:hypothetical protein